jgi:hypothetical protein
MERWQQIESLFQEALQRGSTERDAICAKPATAKPNYSVKSRPCFRITGKVLISSPGPRQQRQN